MVEQYPSNSHKNKTPGERQRLTPVVPEGHAIERKKPLGRRIADTFTGDDAHSVGQYVLFDIALPAMKALLSDVVSQGVDRFLFGGTGIRTSAMRTPGYTTRTSTQQTAYNKVYPTAPKPQQQTRVQSTEDDFSLNEIILPQRGEAEMVLVQLRDRIAQYEFATVTDLKDLINKTGDYIDEKWGWPNLDTAFVRPLGRGYLLVLPKVEPAP